MKRRFFIVLLLISFAVIWIFIMFSANGNFSAEENEPVKIYFVDNISKAHKIIIDKFNKLHAGKIKVVPIDIPFYKFSTNERKELLIRSLRSESKRIDIFAADLIWVNRFAKWAEPLEKYFSQKELEKLLPKALETGKINGHLVASPFYVDVSVMYYRKDLLSELPEWKKTEKEIVNSVTWKKFIELKKKTDFGKDFYIFPADEYEGLICSFTDLVLSRDKNFFNGNFSLTAEPAIKAAKLLSDLTNKYEISPKAIVDFREKNAYNYFLEHNALFLRGWWSFKNDTKNLDKFAGSDTLLGVARLPHFADCETGSTLGGWDLMLAQNSTHKKEAAEFIKFTLTEESQKILFETVSYLPVVKSLYSDEELLERYPDFAFSKQLLDEGFSRPKLPDYTKISDVVSHYLRLAIEGKISPETAMQKAQKQIENGNIF